MRRKRSDVVAAALAALTRARAARLLGPDADPPDVEPAADGQPATSFRRGRPRVVFVPLDPGSRAYAAREHELGHVALSGVVSRSADTAADGEPGQWAEDVRVLARCGRLWARGGVAQVAADAAAADARRAVDLLTLRYVRAVAEVAAASREGADALRGGDADGAALAAGRWDLAVAAAADTWARLALSSSQAAAATRGRSSDPPADDADRAAVAIAAALSGPATATAELCHRHTYGPDGAVGVRDAIGSAAYYAAAAGERGWSAAIAHARLARSAAAAQAIRSAAVYGYVERGERRALAAALRRRGSGRLRALAGDQSAPDRSVRAVYRALAAAWRAGLVELRRELARLFPRPRDGSDVRGQGRPAAADDGAHDAAAGSDGEPMMAAAEPVEVPLRGVARPWACGGATHTPTGVRPRPSRLWRVGVRGAAARVFRRRTRRRAVVVLDMSGSMRWPADALRAVVEAIGGAGEVYGYTAGRVWRLADGRRYADSDAMASVARGGSNGGADGPALLLAAARARAIGARRVVLVGDGCFCGGGPADGAAARFALAEHAAGRLVFVDPPSDLLSAPGGSAAVADAVAAAVARGEEWGADGVVYQLRRRAGR